MVLPEESVVIYLVRFVFSAMHSMKSKENIGALLI